MRVLFFHYSMQAGGTERTIALLANYCVAHGDEVAIATMDAKPSFYALDQRVNHIRLAVVGASKNIIEAIMNNSKRARRLKRAISEVHPDVVVCFSPNTQLSAFLAKGSADFRLIGSVRYNPFARQKGFWERSKRTISRLCDGFIFQTEGARSYYPQSVRNRSIVLKNALEVERYLATEKNWTDRRNICAVGRFEGVKCFGDLLRAFAAVHQKHPEICLDIYGDGSGRDDLERLSSELDLTNVVDFHGKSKTIIEEYAKHKLFVMTSRSEGMPNALLEAMASGCACVSTDCNFGPSELIKTGENGFLAPVHDTKAIADKLCWLIEHDDEARAMGERAKAIRETHSIEHVGAEFREYVEEVIQGKH